MRGRKALIPTSVCLFVRREGDEGESVCVCVFVRAHVCAHVYISNYLGGFSRQGENEYWNDYQLINDPA